MDGTRGPAAPPETVRSLVPARIDRLPWSRFHTRMVAALGVAWVLDGLEIQIASIVGPVLQRADTLHLSSGEVGFSATVYLLGEVFGLRIVGESMIEDGIFDGDYVFVKKTPSAGVGDIVVAMIEGEATVKRYYPEGDRIRFQPANANMSPIIVRRSEFKSVDIIGIVVGVYRKL